MFWVYNLLITFLSPFWVPIMLIRSRRRKEPVNWSERMGDSKVPPRADGKRIWIHAVSVGEVVAAQPVLRELRQALPDFEIVLSTTTSSGQAIARNQVGSDIDHLIYFPIDVVRFQVAAMSRVRPSCVVVMETELWMNFLWAAQQFGAHTMLVNGRISDRSARRLRYFRWLYRGIVRFLDEALMQSETDADRIRSLGAANVSVIGNTKFDQAAEATQNHMDWRQELQLDPERPVVVIGSTRSDEEENWVLDAIEKVGIEQVQVIHAPRHMERADPLAAKVVDRFGVCARRSLGQTGPYLVLDSYGELASVYGVADAVVIGGGFSNLGGQNLLQALAHGKPVICGPHFQNFRSAVDLAKSWGAVVQVEGAELGDAIVAQLAKPQNHLESERVSIQKELSEHQGAASRYVAAIVDAAKEHAARIEAHHQKQKNAGR